MQVGNSVSSLRLKSSHFKLVSALHSADGFMQEDLEVGGCIVEAPLPPLTLL